MPNGDPAFDWPGVAARVKNDDWLLLGTGLKESIARAINQNSIKAMVGVRAVTRNNQMIDGRRYCDIYLRRDES